VDDFFKGSVMKAIRISAFGGPEVIRLEEVGKLHVGTGRQKFLDYSCAAHGETGLFEV